MRRLVYRKNQGPITESNPSWAIEYTNQVYENNEWVFFNRYEGKFGKKPIVWYPTKEWAESCAPEDYEVADMIEWDGKD